MRLNFDFNCCNSFVLSLVDKVSSNTRPATLWEQGRWGAMPPPTFWWSKKRKGKQRKKERVSKQKLLNGCNQGQNVTVLVILERLKCKDFFYRPTMVADNSVPCPLHFEIHFAGPTISCVFKSDFNCCNSLVLLLVDKVTTRTLTFT